MAKQRKVATYRGDVSRKIKSLLECMYAHPEGITPKHIALHTRINVNTIKSLLPKIEGITKKMRGLYVVAEGGDAPIEPLTTWNFHNLHLSCILKDNTHYLVDETYDFGLMTLKFLVSQKGKATLSVATDYPLNVSSICMVAGFFLELIAEHEYISVTFKDIRISTIEFNRDHSNLRLDGVQCITLDSLVEQFKTYQKQRGMRIEHKTKVPFTAQNIIDILSQTPQSVDIHTKLNALIEQVAKLTASLLGVDDDY